MSMNMNTALSAAPTVRPPPIVTPSGVVNLSEVEGCVIDGEFYVDGAQVSPISSFRSIDSVATASRSLWQSTDLEEPAPSLKRRRISISWRRSFII